MRQIVLDTETTGLDTADGHRVIEIGAVEMVDRRLTGRHFHEYLNPDRRIDPGAIEVHGISNEFLADKPRFRDIADDFIGFIDGAELVIHNAPFDIGFLDHELGLLGGRPGRMSDHAAVLDTLELARRMHPGMKNSLDALCRRYEVDNAHRQLHGALLDAQILAEVYLRMTGGQTTLSLEMAGESSGQGSVGVPSQLAPVRVVRANDAERVAHNKRLEAIDKASGGRCLWRADSNDIEPADA